MINALFFILKRLKNWEIRERKKSRDYNKDAERDDDRRREVVNPSMLFKWMCGELNGLAFNSFSLVGTIDF